VVFQTGDGAIGAAIAAGRPLSVEIDHFDDTLAEGWSVLPRGHAAIGAVPTSGGSGGIPEIVIESWAVRRAPRRCIYTRSRSPDAGYAGSCHPQLHADAPRTLRMRANGRREVLATLSTQGTRRVTRSARQASGGARHDRPHPDCPPKEHLGENGGRSADGALRAHERELDFRDGVLWRRAGWVSPADRAVLVSSTYQVEPLDQPVKLVVESELIASEDLPLLRGDPRTGSTVPAPLVERTDAARGTRAGLVHTTRHTEQCIAAVMDHVVDGPPVLLVTSETFPHLARTTVTVRPERGQRLRLVKFVYSWSGVRSSAAVRDQADAALGQAVKTGYRQSIQQSGAVVMSDDSFGARSTLRVGEETYGIYRLDTIEGTAGLPYSLKVLLENLLRHEDGHLVTTGQIEALAGWKPQEVSNTEIQFAPARVLMQDFTGVPCVVDLVAMRDAMTALGGDPGSINPLIPTELVIDHSVIADVFARPDAYRVNADLEFSRNKERYQLLRWAQQAFDDFQVVPPDTGICHQVNLEYLARVVFTRQTSDGLLAYPDTLVGTDSHTPMVNGLGVLGWGVGGIEAEAAMLGQPMSMLIPQVLGFKLTGSLLEGTTATDLVLTIAELLRETGVVGKFVEFYGPGVANVPLANRATIGNMSPEYGSTCAIFPVDGETLNYLRLTGRPEHQIRLVEAYAKEQGMWHDPEHEPIYSEAVELDLATVAPSIAGPKRPQDRIPLAVASHAVGSLLAGKPQSVALQAGLDEAGAESFPASDPIAIDHDRDADGPAAPCRCGEGHDWPSNPVAVQLDDGAQADVDHGHVVIAAITSCTNTSNPTVMIGAALLAKRAVEAGLSSKPWVKTSLAPGSRVVTDYYDRAGLTPYLDKLGFGLVGYGCTTCIGNSGPLIRQVSAAVTGHDLTACSILSGNRNFEGRIHPDVKMNFLTSPPLVIAYALAGTMLADILRDPLGHDADGEPVYLRDIWPTTQEIQTVIAECVRSEMYTRAYADVFAGDEHWRSLDVTAGQIFDWDDASTYVRRPPYFDGMQREPDPIADITGARVLAVLGDSVTTDHISPAGAIKADSPAGTYLQEHGIAPKDFNSYGSRRGNHDVMIRGTFANVRLRNQLAPGTEGGLTRHLPDGRPCPSSTRPPATPPRTCRWSSSPAPSTGPAPRATGPPKAPSCSGSRRSSRPRSNGSTAPTSSAWAYSPCNSQPRTPFRVWG
jgi:aconitate hydratase